MFAKKILATGLAVMVTLGLAACDPPMPPEILAAQAEKVVNCVDGDFGLATPAAITDVVDSWATSIADSCSATTLNKLDAGDTTANGVISLDGTFPEECAPFASFPIAIDGAVVAYALTDAPSLVLTPQNIQDIFSGKVSNWSDPSLKASNPDAVMPDLAINIVGGPQKIVVDSLSTWLKKLGVTFAPSKINVASTDDGSILSTMAEGDVTITSYSNALYAYSTVAAVAVSKKATDLAAIPDSEGLRNGADTSFSAAAGEAPGYGATFPVTLALCGKDNTLARAIARYMVRQDAQGALGSAVVAPLPDSLRVSTIAQVEKGLPKPKQ